MLKAAKLGFKEADNLQVNKILVSFLTSQDAFFKLLRKGTDKPESLMVLEVNV